MVMEPREQVARNIAPSEWAERDRCSQLRDYYDQEYANIQLFGSFEGWVDRMTGPSLKAADAILSALAAHPVEIEAGQWPDIASAPKDGSYILAEVAENDSLQFRHQVGRMFVIRHEGRTASGCDLGWAVYPGYGGAPDSFFSRWQPVPPAPPLSRDTSEIEAALEPFAAFADALNDAVPDNIALAIFADGATMFGPGAPSVGDLRRARSALASLRGARS
jgi:hypothetical protein